jgi:hypothetical protein
MLDISFIELIKSFEKMKMKKNLTEQQSQQEEQYWKYSAAMAILDESLTSKGLRVLGRDLTEKKSPDPTISITFINRSKKD